MIVTSRSAVVAYQTCPRRRYWQYEAENGTPVAGWERRRLSLPLVTGIFVHKGLELALTGMEPTKAAQFASSEYEAEVAKRGLAVEVPEHDHSQCTRERGCIQYEKDAIDEQAHHVEALVLAWCRVRLPYWQENYEVVEVEVEDRVPLSDDVTLAVRADAVVRRKADHRMFVVNFKTVGQVDDRWLKQWEVDPQLMTELLAAERRHGHEFGGVIIEGLIKGRRTPEKDSVGTVTGYRDSSPLLYGYKVDADPPLTIGEYGWEYTRRKGWYRFKTWNENFGAGQGLDYWINWLPEDVVMNSFVEVPAILRDRERIESKVMQIIHIEEQVEVGSRLVRDTASEGLDITQQLDIRFPQNEHSCVYPSVCSCWDLCHTNGVAQDPAGSGLYQPRVDHHAMKEGE